MPRSVKDYTKKRKESLRVGNVVSFNFRARGKQQRYIVVFGLINIFKAKKEGFD